MKPELSAVSDNDAFLQSLVSCISGVECSAFFTSHIGQSQSDQRLLVSAFQSSTCSALAGAITDIEWATEHCPSATSRDSIDIFGKGPGFVVVIELDKCRADQVAKKFVSRMALLSSTRVYFVSVCYPGTENMNRAECAKYFSYCSVLARRMGNHYAGFLVA